MLSMLFLFVNAYVFVVVVVAIIFVYSNVEQCSNTLLKFAVTGLKEFAGIRDSCYF
jgi:hypothetical protein